MTVKKTGCRLLSVLLALIMTVGMLGGITVFAADRKTENAITSVAVQNGKDGRELCITVTFTPNTLADLKNTTLQIFALRTVEQTSSIPYMEPVAFFRPQELESKIIVPCRDDPALLYSYFVVCRFNSDGSHRFLTALHGLDNPQALADPNNHAPALQTKKGLCAPTPSDLFDAGASATVVQVALNELFTSDPEAEDVIPIAEGAAFSVRRSAIEFLDQRIRMLRDGGVVVYLQFVLSSPNMTMGDAMDCLYPAGVSETAAHYAIGAQSADAGNCLIDLFNFLARRYGTDADGTQCANWILGDRVNTSTPFNYSGKSDLAAYCEEYASALRLANICLRSVCGEGRVYVPVSNRYAEHSVPEEQIRFGSAEFLTELSSVIRQTGDFPWQVAADLTPSETNRGDIRSDPDITFDENSPYLTPANFSLLQNLLNRGDMTYQDAARSVMVYRFSLLGAYGDPETEGMQAANFVYSYAALNRVPNVECIVYSAYANNDSVGGIGGLCDGSDAAPGAPKAILDVFRSIDTDRAGDAASPFLSYLGMKGWSELLPDFTPSELTQRKRITVSGKPVAAPLGDSVWSFEHDLCGFVPSENATFCELRTDETGGTFLFADFYETDTPAYMGISRSFPDGWSVKSLQDLSLDFCVIAPEGVQTAEVLLRITGQGKTPVTYEGTAFVSCNAWQTVCFDLAPLRASLDSVSDLRILVRPADETYQKGDYCLLLNSISAQTSVASRIWVVVLYVLSVLLFVVAAFYIFVLVCNIRNARRRKKAALRRRPVR